MTSSNSEMRSETVEGTQQAPDVASGILFTREQIIHLPLREQVNIFVRRMESAPDRDMAIALMYEASVYGYVEEYKNGKWRPAKGAKGEGAEEIIKAFVKIPKTQQEILEIRDEARFREELGEEVFF